MKEKQLSEETIQLIKTLDEISIRERSVLILRFVAKMSLDDVGKIYRISDERVREIERAGVNKIENYVSSSKRIRARQKRVRKKSNK